MTHSSNLITPKLYNSYLTNLLNGNRKFCVDIVSGLLNKDIELKILYRELFQKSLYEVGTLWENNKISVAVEHLATSITSSLMNMAYPTLFKSEKKDYKSLITCVANEFHQIGAQMVSDIFELNGWNSYFLGSNTPDKDLFKMIETEKPDVLGLSLSVYFNLPVLLDLLEKIDRNLSELNIIVGGQAFRWGGAESLNQFKRVKYISDLDMLEKYMLS